MTSFPLATIPPVGTLLLLVCALALVVAAIGVIPYVIGQAVVHAVALLADHATRALTSARQTTRPALPIVSGPAGPSSVGPPVLTPYGSDAPRRDHLAPVQTALPHRVGHLAGATLRWLATASGDQPSPAAHRRALAEMIVLAVFWLLASASDLQVTYARLVGASGDLAGAYAASGSGLDWTFAVVIVANLGMFSAALLAVTGAAGHTVLVPDDDRQMMRRAVLVFLAITIAAAVALSIAAQEEVDGVHDAVLWDGFYGGITLCLGAAIGLGGIARAGDRGPGRCPGVLARVVAARDAAPSAAHGARRCRHPTHTRAHRPPCCGHLRPARPQWASSGHERRHEGGATMIHDLLRLPLELPVAALLPFAPALFLDHTVARAVSGRRRYALTGAYARLWIRVLSRVLGAGGHVLAVLLAFVRGTRNAGGGGPRP